MGDLAHATQTTPAQAPQVAPQVTAPATSSGTGMSSGTEVGRAVTGQNTKGNSAVAGEVSEQTAARLPTPLPGMIGKVGYYEARKDDFVSRHSSASPPDYYMNYGDKYAKRFTTVLKPTLSGEGQAWLQRAFVLLQQAMENRLTTSRSAFATLELNGAAFRAFAYGTHPNAYVAAGLSKLPPSDLLKISTTPDMGDLLTIDGVSQMVETGLKVLPQWGSQGVDWAAKKGGQAADLGKQAWDWATDW